MLRLLTETDLFSFDLQKALGGISAERREKALRYRYERGQRECVLAYMLLKRGLSELYGIDENPAITSEGGGKPMLRDHPGIHFNIRHCKEAVAVAVGDETVGVDVEAMREYKPELARYVLSDEELADVLASDNPALKFTVYWTQKEALLKLTGQGIRSNMKTVLPNPGVAFDTRIYDTFVLTVARNRK